MCVKPSSFRRTKMTGTAIGTAGIFIASTVLLGGLFLSARYLWADHSLHLLKRQAHQNFRKLTVSLKKIEGAIERTHESLLTVVEPQSKDPQELENLLKTLELECIGHLETLDALQISLITSHVTDEQILRLDMVSKQAIQSLIQKIKLRKKEAVEKVQGYMARLDGICQEHSLPSVSLIHAAAVM